LNFPTQKKRARWNVSPELSQSQTNQFYFVIIKEKKGFGIVYWLFSVGIARIKYSYGFLCSL